MNCSNRQFSHTHQQTLLHSAIEKESRLPAGLVFLAFRRCGLLRPGALEVSRCEVARGVRIGTAAPDLPTLAVSRPSGLAVPLVFGIGNPPPKTLDQINQTKSIGRQVILSKY